MDLTNPGNNFYQPGNTYEVWITKTNYPTDAKNQNEREDIEVDGSEGSSNKTDKCFYLKFQKVHSDDSVVTEDEQTLTA